MEENVKVGMMATCKNVPLIALAFNEKRELSVQVGTGEEGGGDNVMNSSGGREGGGMKNSNELTIVTTCPLKESRNQKESIL